MADAGADRPGPLLLQGGAEMQPGCRETDSAFLALADDGPLVVLLGAASPGADHDRSSDRALRYYEQLVPGREVVVAPHPEDDLERCVSVVRRAAVVVMPGGSPSRLLAGLRADGSRLGDLLTERRRAGLALSGSSAGAMVMCARTALPDRRSGAGPAVVDGLALVPGLALVHDSGRGDGGWRDPVDPLGIRWGLPEQGGLLVVADSVRAVGRGPVRLLRPGGVGALSSDAVPLADLLRG